MEMGDRSDTVDLIGREGAKNPRPGYFLPIREALEHLQYADYKALGISIAPLIALDLLWRETDNDATASTLRFATGNFLRQAGTAKPSELIDQREKFDHDELLYFLTKICVPNIIDVARIFRSSREVLEERQAICGALNTLDPSNTQEYQTEIFSITSRLKIAEGLRIVDANRIHVDVDAVSRWAHRTITEDYARYKDLAQTETEGKASVTLFKDLDAVTKGTDQTFFTPDVEDELVLIELIHRIREEFLNNSNHGLDYFLSKRVRHQSFIGLVRGPLEFAQVITTRESERGEYRSNTFWLEKLKAIDTTARAEIDAAFKHFAETFDGLLSDVKDNLFHVISSDKPRGLFWIEISTPLLVTARQVFVGSRSSFG